MYTKELYAFKIKQKTNALYLRELHTWSGDRETFKVPPHPQTIRVVLLLEKNEYMVYNVRFTPNNPAKYPFKAEMVHLQW